MLSPCLAAQWKLFFLVSLYNQARIRRKNLQWSDQKTEDSEYPGLLFEIPLEVSEWATSIGVAGTEENAEASVGQIV